VQVAKNLVLAGVGNITISDERTASPGEEDNFLVPCDTTEGTLISQACAESLREMNPLVTITHGDSNAMAFAESKDLGDYNSVLAFDVPAPCIQKLDSLCSEVNVPFASCTCRGVSGWIFLNPQNHEYIVEVGYFNFIIYGMRWSSHSRLLFPEYYWEFKWRDCEESASPQDSGFKLSGCIQNYV